MGIEIIWYDTTDSTQIRAKELLRSLAPLAVRAAAPLRSARDKKTREKCPPFCVAAGSQMGGYGQAGRKYYCPSGGAYMSLVLPAADFPYKFTTGFVAVCVAEVIASLQNAGQGSNSQSDTRTLSIKWINDLFLDNKKVGGVLIEAVTPAPNIEKYFIIGIGVNLIQSQPIPDDLKSKMGFINTAISPKDFINKVIKKITTAKLTDEQVLAKYKNYCDINGLNIDGSVDVCVDGKIIKKLSSL